MMEGHYGGGHMMHGMVHPQSYGHENGELTDSGHLSYEGPDIHDLKHGEIKELRKDIEVLRGELQEARERSDVFKAESLARAQMNHVDNDYLQQEVNNLNQEVLVLSRRAGQTLAMEKELHELRSALAMQEGSKTTDTDVAKLKKALAKISNEVSAYIDEIQAVSESFGELQSRNMKLQKLVTEQTRAQRKLKENYLSEKFQKETSEKQIGREMEKLAKEKSRLEETKDSFFEAQKNKDIYIGKCKQELKTKQLECESKDDAIAKASETETLLRSELTQSEARVEELSQEIQQEKRRRLDAAQGDGGGAGSSGPGVSEKEKKVLEEQVKYYQKMVICNICNDRHKSHVISKCLHMFCYECIKKCVDTRSRKCPRCGKMFQSSDIQKIYF